MTLVPGFWCQVRGYGWLPDSPTACTDEDHIREHRHIPSECNPAQPGHSLTADWLQEDEHGS